MAPPLSSYVQDAQHSAWRDLLLDRYASGPREAPPVSRDKDGDAHPEECREQRSEQLADDNIDFAVWQKLHHHRADGYGPCAADSHPGQPDSVAEPTRSADESDTNLTAAQPVEPRATNSGGAAQPPWPDESIGLFLPTSR